MASREARRVLLTFTSFKMLPNSKELLQTSSKASLKTCSLWSSCGSHAHTFWSSWGTGCSGLLHAFRPALGLRSQSWGLPLEGD